MTDHRTELEGQQSLLGNPNDWLTNHPAFQDWAAGDDVRHLGSDNGDYWFNTGAGGAAMTSDYSLTVTPDHDGSTAWFGHLLSNGRPGADRWTSPSEPGADFQ